MGDSSAMVVHLSCIPLLLGFAAGNRFCKENAACKSEAAFSVSHLGQWQPPQVEQLPVQEALGSCTVMGSPPFMAVLMMASI